MSRRVLFAVCAVLAGALIAVPIAVYASHQFTDVPTSNIFHDDISWLSNAGVTKGCNLGGTEYCPKDFVTREQMAAFMHRLADDQANIAYLIAADASMEIKGEDFYETALELEGLPAGSYHVIAKGEFHSSEIITKALPRCKLMAGHEFDTTSPSVDPGQTVPWSLTAVTYLAEDNSVVHLDCRDHGELVTLNNTRITAVGVNEIVINPLRVP